MTSARTQVEADTHARSNLPEHLMPHQWDRPCHKRKWTMDNTTKSTMTHTDMKTCSTILVNTFNILKGEFLDTVHAYEIVFAHRQWQTLLSDVAMRAVLSKQSNNSDADILAFFDPVQQLTETFGEYSQVRSYFWWCRGSAFLVVLFQSMPTCRWRCPPTPRPPEPRSQSKIFCRSSRRLPKSSPSSARETDVTCQVCKNMSC